MEIDAASLQTLIEALIALILAFIAIMNKKRTDSAAITAAATTQTAATNASIAAIAASSTPAVTVSAEPASMIPQPAGYGTPIYSTSYRMREVTIDFLRSSITDPADWNNAIAQIARAELQNLSDYIITWSHGRFAHIHYGTWMATNGQKTFISQVIGGAFDDTQGIAPPTK